MEPYTQQEINIMRTTFNVIEKAFVSMDESVFEEDTRQQRRLNKKLVTELAKEVPDHEKIYLLLNAINTTQNGKQQTTTAFPPKAQPESKKVNRIQRWIKKIRQARK